MGQTCSMLDLCENSPHSSWLADEHPVVPMQAFTDHDPVSWQGTSREDFAGQRSPTGAWNNDPNAQPGLGKHEEPENADHAMLCAQFAEEVVPQLKVFDIERVPIALTPHPPGNGAAVLHDEGVHR